MASQATGDGPWTKVQVGDVPVDQGSPSPKSLGVVADGQGGLTLVAAQQGRNDLVAWGSFTDSLDEVGWMGLSVHVSEGGNVEDSVKMYAAGLLEGFATAGRIREFRDNSRALLEMNGESQAKLPALKQALGTIAAGLAEKAGQPAAMAGSKFDAQARLTFLQTWGVRDGYSLAAQRSSSLSGAEPLTMVDMFILNSDGVIDELLTKYGGHESLGEVMLQERSTRGKVHWHPKTAPRRHANRTLAGHCTGLVRLSQDKSELYFGHTTWEGFSEMTRIWKVYDFPLQDVTARRISFSSYPGCVSSTDDYYLMDSGLAVTETTLNIPKDQHYSASASVPDFIRIMAANRLSASGEDWVSSMTDSATGTYSSQWLVVDYKKFTPGASLPPGSFYVLEQAPGISHSEDVKHAGGEGLLGLLRPGFLRRRAREHWGHSHGTEARASGRH
jgi:hypothetical protein